MEYTTTRRSGMISILLLLAHSFQISFGNPTLPSFQSGPSLGNCYAGGFVYDSENGLFYLTGAAYSGTSTGESSCFLKILTSELDPSDERVYGYADVPETCSAIALDTTTLDEDAAIVLGGSAEAGGLYTPPGGGSAAASGFLFNVGAEASSAQGETVTGMIGSIIDGTSIVESAVNYPIAVTADGPNIYVVTMTSSNPSITPEGTDAGEMPNWTTGGIFKYGSGYSMTVQRYTSDSGKHVLDWSKEYAASGNFPTVKVGGLLVQDNVLYIVGTTRGSGDAFGGAGQADTTNDGFITKLDTSTGDLLLPLDTNVARIGESDRNDKVMNICEDPNDPSAMYIVGAETNLFGFIRPSVSRVNAGTLTQEWTEILEVSRSVDVVLAGGEVDGDVDGEEAEVATEQDETVRHLQEGEEEGDVVVADVNVAPSAEAYGLSCQVSGTILYVAGQVRAGTVIDGASSSQGGDDVFIAKFDTGSGKLLWLRQVGSPNGNEKLSRGNGLAVDAHDNAVLYGHTSGSLFREKTPDDTFTDLFAMAFAKQDGSHPEIGVVSKISEVDTSTGPLKQGRPTLFDESQLGKQVEGPIYAGGLAYSNEANKVYFTGALYNDGKTTYASSECFLGEIDLSDSTTKVVALGVSDVPEACSAIAYVGGNKPKAFIIGNTEYGGLNTHLADPNSVSSTKQFGSVLEILLDDTVDGDTALNGHLIGNEVVTYPVAIVTEEGTSNVYVASLATNDGTITADDLAVKMSEYPDLTSGGLRRFGQNYYLRYTKVNIDTQTVVEQNFATDDDFSVYPSGIAIVGDFVIIVGDTRGSGVDFGKTDAEDIDGFVIKLSGTVGGSFEPPEANHIRLDSTNSDDDWINQICTDPNDQDNFYVVGATTGLPKAFGRTITPASIRPIVVKISVSSMEVLWWTEIETTHPDITSSRDASAYGCVFDDGHVYLAGIVKDGVSIVSPDNEEQLARGMNDLFVAKVEAVSGEVSWARQFGTSKNEGLGRGGGITVDGSGNVLVLGQTDGSFYSQVATESEIRKLQSSNINDLLVFSVGPDGAFRTPTGRDAIPTPPPVSGPTTSPVQDPVVTPAPVEPTPAPVEDPTPAPVEDSVPTTSPVLSPAPVEPPVKDPPAPADTEAPAPAPSEGDDDDDEDEGPIDMLAFILSMVFVTLWCCCLVICCIRGRQTREERESQNMANIFKQQRDSFVLADDMENRRSLAMPTTTYVDEEDSSETGHQPSSSGKYSDADDDDDDDGDEEEHSQTSLSAQL